MQIRVNPLPVNVVHAQEHQFTCDQKDVKKENYNEGDDETASYFEMLMVL